jgi:hypothetical protein
MDNIIPNLKVLKKDAIVDVKISAWMIEKLNESLSIFLNLFSITKEEMDEFYEEAKNIKEIYIRKEKEFSKAWMYPVATITILLQDIERAAEKQNLLSEITAEDYLKSVINTDDSSLADQSQSQPE